MQSSDPSGTQHTTTRKKPVQLTHRLTFIRSRVVTRCAALAKLRRPTTTVLILTILHPSDASKPWGHLKQVFGRCNSHTAEQNSYRSMRQHNHLIAERGGQLSRKRTSSDLESHPNNIFSEWKDGNEFLRNFASLFVVFSPKVMNLTCTQLNEHIAQIIRKSVGNMWGKKFCLKMGGCLARHSRSKTLNG
ncbi:hypothetical protein KIN20_034404 [Parelaphostrongylus tenuis]|uniref:Uncharacterized protein n=1 Tax=Parelaphostrongylus tenuis TaxID=148309 RepID=A0AAD5R9M6_PARTN|nr:hypothetical protein KIN20_034404 [Parelaphostrongylus tenuis]